jgi:hypothetical protein
MLFAREDGPSLYEPQREQLLSIAAYGDILHFRGQVFGVFAQEVVGWSRANLNHPQTRLVCRVPRHLPSGSLSRDRSWMDGEGEVVVAREHGQPGDATGIERRWPCPVDRGQPSEAFASVVQADDVGPWHVPAQAQGVSTETAEHRCDDNRLGRVARVNASRGVRNALDLCKLNQAIDLLSQP